MSENIEFNSQVYWDHRFKNNWDDFGGSIQSRFFADLTIKHLPKWLIPLIIQKSLTLVDWGCAQGDGTATLAEHIPSHLLTGVDFSDVAIEHAKHRYPNIAFVSENWVRNDPQETKSSFDIVFSSNTLEHFYEPWEVLNKLCNRAKKAILLAIPYREKNLIDEHFYSFLPTNIPCRLDNGFSLVWYDTVDCADMPNTMWNGEQIFLLYADPVWIGSLDLKLDDIASAQKENLSHRLKQISIQKNQLISEKTQLISENAQLISEKTQLISENMVLGKKSAQLQKELEALSVYTKKIDTHPFRHGIKKTSYQAAKAVFHRLPINLSSKQNLRFLLSKLRSFLKKTPKNTPIFLSSTPLQTNKAKSDIFIFSVIDWHFRIQRPQHLAREFAQAGHRVFFISPHFIDSNEPGYQLERLDENTNLYQIRFHVQGAPAIYFAAPDATCLEMLSLGMAKLLSDFGVCHYHSLIQHAFWYPLLKRLPNTSAVYDCMDHHEGFGNVPAQLLELEELMLKEADLVVVTSGWLENIAKKHNSHVKIIRNAGEFTHFSTHPQEIYQDPGKRSIIGYFGAIAEWFDIDLIRNIANSYPTCLVLLIGNDTVGAQKSLADLNNVQFTGEVSYGDLPFYLHAFDVCLLPFKKTPLTLATNPVKVYEYLAAGKPTVCVDLPEINQFEGLVWQAKTSEQFVAFVGDALASKTTRESRDARREFAIKQAWRVRVDELNLALTNLVLPKVSVIVLTYNNLHLTQACLDSLLNYSLYPNLEIIVVDNASSDETPNYLANLSRENPQIKVILNKRNLGFAAGNNVGLACATGDYLVLLNNDTVVTPGWVLTLLRHLQHDSTIGIVGPVTNNIGNKARIRIDYTDIKDMPLTARSHTLIQMGQAESIKTLAFFCVMFPRKTYELCGPLCEDYGMGFFEDDDYCRRIEQKGLSLRLAKDVFIHHHLSASFNKIGAKEKNELFEKNKSIYKSKWGPWVPHSYDQ